MSGLISIPEKTELMTRGVLRVSRFFRVSSWDCGVVRQVFIFPDNSKRSFPRTSPPLPQLRLIYFVFVISM